jgi:hypothetical protein
LTVMTAVELNDAGNGASTSRDICVTSSVTFLRT